MAGDKDIQTQDQTYQVQVYCAVVDGYLGSGCFLLSVYTYFEGKSTKLPPHFVSKLLSYKITVSSEQ